MGAEAWALTFSEHPLRALRPEAAPPLLTSAAHKLFLLKEAGMDGVIMLRFTPALAAVSASDFVSRLVGSAPSLVAIVVGRNWTFGRGGQGNTTLLRRLCTGHGLTLRVVNSLCHDNEPVSSTRIRRSLAQGDLEAVRQLLGRPFSVMGTVVQGLGLGRKLGAPTANIEPHHEARPPNGVYAVLAVVRGRAYPGVASLGIRPTLPKASGRAPLLEAHLFDVSLDLYGETMDVFFIKHLRGERKFASLDELGRRIKLDIADARRAFKSMAGYSLFAADQKTIKRMLYNPCGLI